MNDFFRKDDPGDGEKGIVRLRSGLAQPSPNIKIALDQLTDVEAVKKACSAIQNLFKYVGLNWTPFEGGNGLTEEQLSIARQRMGNISTEENPYYLLNRFNALYEYFNSLGIDPSQHPKLHETKVEVETILEAAIKKKLNMEGAEDHTGTLTEQIARQAKQASRVDPNSLN